MIWSIERLADTIKQTIDKKFDFIVAVDGKRGLGKSTLAIKTALRFDTFKMKKHIIFKRDDIMEWLGKSKYETAVLDEMIGAMHNRDFFSGEQKKLIKMLNMYRDSCNVIFACIPNFAHLDNQFRDLIKMRIHIERRGLGVIHVPNQSSYSKDKWDMSINEKIEAGWAKRGNYSPNWKRLTTFKGIIHFGPLTEKQQLLYDDIKAEKRNVAMMEGEAEAENAKEGVGDRIVRMIEQKTITDRKQLRVMAMATGNSYDSFRKIVQRAAEKQGKDWKSLWVDDIREEKQHTKILNDKPVLVLPKSLKIPK